jgi:hypothetical protein
MISYSFYHKESGVIHSRRFSTDDPTQLRGNTPADHAAIEGHHDHLSKRFDLETKQVVEWMPPAPSADHVWNPETKRWQLSAAAAEKIERSNAARVRIAQLEASQHRHVREHCLGFSGAADRLQAIDAEIATLREVL